MSNNYYDCLYVPIRCNSCYFGGMEYVSYDKYNDNHPGIENRQHILICPWCGKQEHLLYPPLIFIRSSNGINITQMENIIGKKRKDYGMD